MTVVVLHSTEGPTLDGALATLRANGSASHEVWEIGGEQVQLVPLDQPARSLVNRPGGVETNRRGGVVQIELVGYASAYSAAGKPPAPIMDALDDDQLRWLGTHLRELCTQVGAPFTFPCRFAPYPASHGASSGVRLSFADWLSVEGVIGHQHVPENDHGDPGALDVARMAALTEPAPPTLTAPLATTEAPSMLHLIVTDDPAYPSNITPGVHLVYTGDRVAWIRSGAALGILNRSPVPVVHTTVTEVAALLESVPGDGPSPRTAGCSFGW